MHLLTCALGKTEYRYSLSERGVGVGLHNITKPGHSGALYSVGVHTYKWNS